jgi:hypothetical protein
MTSTNSPTVFIIDDDARNAYSDACLSKGVGVIPSRLGDLPPNSATEDSLALSSVTATAEKYEGRILRASSSGAGWDPESVACCSCAFPP